jgi:hypothetical protein
MQWWLLSFLDGRHSKNVVTWVVSENVGLRSRRMALRSSYMNFFNGFKLSEFGKCSFRPPKLGNTPLPYTLDQGSCDFPNDVKNF